ncbi:CubicO group peptidase, beta-lactamase class C family [Chryseobacterium polytrichastri]|uniref:CubicO group peptidase, beta-lactamase class C family n=2 Tax=Chryseobacterium polytrichastri TaxID=1302687 RepID=A0A1M6RZ09_9FLAO|nr:CubicO group peptidase, beta-lactamase class C family [Chryseobacterium polytrichastri]
MRISTIKSIFVFEILLFMILFSCGKNSNEIISEYHKKGQFNGTVLVMKNDHIISDTALGFSNFQTQEKLNIDTPFYIASLSKSFTATAIILLQQKGLLSFDDKASKYLPELPAYAKDITIRHLLTHTSGIWDYEKEMSGKKELKNQDVLNWLQQKKKLQFPSGSKFEYSNSGYIILSLIIEKTSGKSYAEFLNENIFVPLKMNNTKVYDESMPVIKNKALGYNQQRQPDDYSLLTTGDGGIYSTTKDLYKFDKALRNFSLINKNNTVLMYTPFKLSDKTLSNYGFGWYIDDSNNGQIVSHTGGLNGFRALFWRDLKNNKIVIALTNQGDAFQLNNFLNDIKKYLD